MRSLSWLFMSGCTALTRTQPLLDRFAAPALSRTQNRVLWEVDEEIGATSTKLHEASELVSGPLMTNTGRRSSWYWRSSFGGSVRSRSRT